MNEKINYERSFIADKQYFVGDSLWFIERIYIAKNPILIRSKTIDYKTNKILFKAYTKYHHEDGKQDKQIRIIDEDAFNDAKQYAIGYDTCESKYNNSLRKSVLRRHYPDDFSFYYTEYNFDTRNINDRFIPPKWVGDEITYIKKFRGINMAIAHFIKDKFEHQNTITVEMATICAPKSDG
jgi:hypothetical protein